MNENLVEYVPSEAKANETDDETTTRLAALPLAEYDRGREAEAKRLNVRVGTLDKMVERARGSDETETADSLLFPEIPLWPHPVGGAALLTELSETFTRYMVLPAGAADAIALWTLFTHCHDTATISPILAITSPAPECGKTTLLTLLAALVPKALPTSNITAAALFRSVEKWAPTLLVDEADTFLQGSDDLRGIINSGHNRAGAFVIRTTGDDHEPRRFTTWTAKAIALIGKLPPTLASRSIHIELRRMAPGESVEPVRADRLDHLQPLASRAARWVADNKIALADADPTMPEILRGRAADNWRILCAIAQVAGGGWLERAHAVARTLTAADAGQTAAIMVLEDISDIFGTDDRISSAVLAETLAGMEARPWPEWRKGKPITPRQLARLLEPFDIAPGTIRTSSGTPKGYRKEQFDDAFARYLVPDPPHRHNPQKTAENTGVRSVTFSDDVTDRETLKPAASLVCDGVTDRNPETSDERVDRLEREAIQWEGGGAA